VSIDEEFKVSGIKENPKKSQDVEPKTEENDGFEIGEVGEIDIQKQVSRGQPQFKTRGGP